mmetsp:Transcript_11404/g.36512  ORF Transcript_11404/g.36512 Transcript_11404/m.36512 type:complete len:371 (-) Transcript_11404:574-1686(-)
MGRWLVKKCCGLSVSRTVPLLRLSPRRRISLTQISQPSMQFYLCLARDAEPSAQCFEGLHLLVGDAVPPDAHFGEAGQDRRGRPPALEPRRLLPHKPQLFQVSSYGVAPALLCARGGRRPRLRHEHLGRRQHLVCILGRLARRLARRRLLDVRPPLRRTDARLFRRAPNVQDSGPALELRDARLQGVVDEPLLDPRLLEAQLVPLALERPPRLALIEKGCHVHEALVADLVVEEVEGLGERAVAEAQRVAQHRRPLRPDRVGRERDRLQPLAVWKPEADEALQLRGAPSARVEPAVFTATGIRRRRSRARSRAHAARVRTAAASRCGGSSPPSWRRGKWPARRLRRRRTSARRATRGARPGRWAVAVRRA